MSPKYIVAIGNPIDGLSFYGPFESVDDALKYGEDFAPRSEWWMANLLTPFTIVTEIEEKKQHQRDLDDLNKDGW